MANLRQDAGGRITCFAGNGPADDLLLRAKGFGAFACPRVCPPVARCHFSRELRTVQDVTLGYFKLSKD